MTCATFVADPLPKEAFFLEGGQRLVEKGRDQLDYQNPEVRNLMHKVVQNLVVGCGAGDFRLDSKIEAVQGTDVDGPSSTGDEHLEHQLPYLGWVWPSLDKYLGTND